MRVQREQALKQNIFIKVLLIYNVVFQLYSKNESVTHMYVSLIHIHICIYKYIIHTYIHICGFLGASDGKESACNAGDSV